MTWGEAVRLTRVLLQDPASHVHAALAGWAFPVSREWLVAADTYHAYLALRAANPERHRLTLPWDDTGTSRRHGTASMAPEQLRAVLDAHRALPAEVEQGTVHTAEGEETA